MRYIESQHNSMNETKTATTAASAPNAETGATEGAQRATSRCRTFCSVTTACSFVARSRKYLLGGEA